MTRLGRRVSAEEENDPVSFHILLFIITNLKKLTVIPTQSSLPTSRETSTPLPTFQLWSILFLFLQSLSVLPSLIGFFYSAHRFYTSPSSSAHLLLASSTWLEGGNAIGVTEGRSTRLDWFISGLWALACAYFSHSLAKGLLRRWLVYYSLAPTVIRVLSLQAICWPLCLTTHRVLSFDQPVAAWWLCATTAAVSVSFFSSLQP